MDKPLAMSPSLVATYRVQFREDWGFDAAAGLADYLVSLGVSHLYTAPCLQAAAGSTHGYDVVDPTRVSRELGGEQAHDRLTESLRTHGLRRVQDIVPNHMSISGPDNPWWWDILENGRCSLYASYFDVQWHHPEDRFQNLILLPVLGDHYGRVLEAGDIRISRSGGSFLVCYYEQRFPLSPRSLPGLLYVAAGQCGSDELTSIADELGRLPQATETDASSIEERHQHKEELRRRLNELCEAAPNVAEAIDDAIEQVNRDYTQLDELLSAQTYRLAYWRMAQQDLGYRRFFDIDTLIGLRVEDEQVFADSHVRIIAWANNGVIDGIRVDHPDGLHDPQGYFERLHSAAPRAWLLAEKILEPEETLPETWPVHGTTGYDFLNQVGGVFVDPQGEPEMTAFYAGFTGRSADYPAVVREKKLLVLHDVLGSEVNRLSAMLIDVCEKHPRHRDYARNELADALTELVANFPVYRTYIRPGATEIDAQDARWIDEAVAASVENRPDLPGDLFDFIGDLLRLRIRGDAEHEFVMRFQQFTGPAMAKGVEDTTFYCFNRLVSLNEVGGDPGRFGHGVEDLHRYCRFMQAHWPLTMLTTSTHDTKRSEDVRARIHLLSEMPAAWREAVVRWSQMNEKHRTENMPDRNIEYLLYQSLVGAWPIDLQRITAYIEKASREAKAHTSWINPNAPYDEALQTFVAGAMNDFEFITDLEAFVRPLVEPGRITSLAQTLIKLTAPGVPDIYQGTELWDLSLVDPDNRRPVDYDLRRRLMVQMETLSPEAIWSRADEGLPKLFVTRQALAARRRFADAFGPTGAYESLHADGARADHVIAFARGRRVVSVAPRLCIGLRGDWQDTTVQLPPGEWDNVTGGSGTIAGKVRLAELLKKFPVALLLRKDR